MLQKTAEEVAAQQAAEPYNEVQKVCESERVSQKYEQQANDSECGRGEED